MAEHWISNREALGLGAWSFVLMQNTLPLLSTGQYPGRCGSVQCPDMENVDWDIKIQYKRNTNLKCPRLTCELIGWTYNYIMFAFKDTLLVQCESALQMLGANKMPPF